MSALVSPDVARVFWTGRSQAVRLPQAFRVQAERMRIARRGQSIVLTPIADDWGWLDALPSTVGAFSGDAAVAAESRVQEQDRPALDQLFK